MRVLVTGANGFVGATLCKKLIEQGYRVRGLTRQTSDLSLLQNIPIEHMIGSLEDVDSLSAAVKGMNLVYHVAAAVTDWGTRDYFQRVNVEGTKNILNASVMAHINRFVFVSSVVVHSFLGAHDMNENAPQLATPYLYCQTKRKAEDIVLKYHHQGKVEVVIVRPGDIYGPGDRVSLLKMANMLEKGMMAYISGGKKLGAFTYIENLADGLILAGIKKEAAGEVFVITDGIKLTWRDYFERLTMALNVPRPRISVPGRIAFLLGYFLEGIHHLFRIQSRPLLTKYIADHLRKDFHFSIQKARDLLDFEPKIGFEEAIERTASWYKRVVRGENI